MRVNGPPKARKSYPVVAGGYALAARAAMVSEHAKQVALAAATGFHPGRWRAPAGMGRAQLPNPARMSPLAPRWWHLSAKQRVALDPGVTVGEYLGHATRLRDANAKRQRKAAALRHVQARGGIA